MIKEISQEECILKANEKLKKSREYYDDLSHQGKISRRAGLVGLTCLSYIGLRYLLGTDLSQIAMQDNPKSPLEYIDVVAMGIGGICSIYGLAGLVTYIDELSCKKEIGELERDLQYLKREN